MMRQLRFIAVAATILFSTSAEAQKVKFATLAPEGTLYYDALREMADSWRETSQGRVVLKIFPGGIAGDEGDIVRKMRIGQIQASLMTGGGLADIAPEVRALQMPMMFASFEELDFVRDRVKSRIEAAIEKQGFKVLGWGDAGWLYFFSQTPIVHPDDLKPLKLFAWTGNTTFLEAWKDLGYRPVPMSVTDIHLGLASKLINVVVVPPIGALSFQWFALAKHMTDLKFAPLVGAIIIALKTWEAIPADLRPELQQAANRASRRMQGGRDLNDKAIRVMQEHGLVIHAVPKDIKKLWETRARLAYPRLTRNAIPADLVAEVEALRNAYREQHGR